MRPMECAGCGFDIQSGFAFCPRCGAKQPISCAACGYPCQPDFAFCPSCGASISDKAQLPTKPTIEAMPAKSEGDADRRPVTVLFADLCGFTTLSEQIDPEVMRVLQNELFEEMTQSVEAYGGFVDKFVGDALLALFGAPVAHEDDPVRALHVIRRGIPRCEARRCPSARARPPPRCFRRRRTPILVVSRIFTRRMRHPLRTPCHVILEGCRWPGRARRRFAACRPGAASRSRKTQPRRSADHPGE